MNILPKKRWHVRTKDNIARVRKDEAAAREEEYKRQEKLKLAESEARVNFLLKRSGLSEKKQHIEKTGYKQPLNEDACRSQHVNLFADYKTHVKTTNKELEKEKKEEKEKYEKKIGYLTYLGQDTNEALKLKSWYEVAPKRLSVGSERSEINEKDLKIKHNHDPLTLINALLQPDPKPIAKSTTSLKRKRSPSPKLPKETVGYKKPSKKPKKEHKKHKKEKRLKRHKYETESSKGKMEEIIQKRLRIEQLRKERLNRETVERARQEALLTPKDAVKPTEVASSSTAKVVQKYNSQFNPELAKQNIY